MIDLSATFPPVLPITLLVCCRRGAIRLMQLPDPLGARGGQRLRPWSQAASRCLPGNSIGPSLSRS